MQVGVPKEIFPGEHRVALTPPCVRSLRQDGHFVLVERGAGLGAGVGDVDLMDAGAEVVSTAEEIYARADLIWKVLPPEPSEVGLLKRGQRLFALLHPAAHPARVAQLDQLGVAWVAAEGLQEGGRYSVQEPMSAVVGRLAVFAGARGLEQQQGGRGLLLGGVPGVPPARVAILGGGVVGRNAARLAVALGADVTVLDLDIHALRQVEAGVVGRVGTLLFAPDTVEAALADADLVIGAAAQRGAPSPRLASRAHLQLMKPGAVIVDVAIADGGNFETSRPTTHLAPAYVTDGIVHQAVVNLPGAVARTATLALANAALPFVRRWAAGPRP